MRLNDPQIELVHDDPFMGYIETAPTQSSDTGAAAAAIRRRAPLDSIADGEDTPSAAADDDIDVEEVDVGDESSRHPPPQPLPASPRVSDSVASARSDRITDGAAPPTSSSVAATDPSIVIVLLVE